MKKASLVFGSTTIAAIRVGGAALVMGGFSWRMWRPFPLSRRQLAGLLGLALLGFVCPYALQPYLISRGGSGYIGMIVGLVPVLTIIVSLPILGQLPSRIQLLGVIVGLGCMVVIGLDGLDRALSPRLLALAISVPFCYAMANTLTKRFFVAVPTPVLTTTIFSLSTLMLLPLALRESVNYNTPDFWQGVLAVSVLSGLGTGVAMLAFFKLIQEQGPLFAGMVTYLIPIGAVTWGMLDGEAVTLKQEIALGVILLSVAVVQIATPKVSSATSGDGKREAVEIVQEKG